MIARLDFIRRLSPVGLVPALAVAFGACADTNSKTDLVGKPEIEKSSQSLWANFLLVRHLTGMPEFWRKPVYEDLSRFPSAILPQSAR